MHPFATRTGKTALPALAAVVLLLAALTCAVPGLAAQPAPSTDANGAVPPALLAAPRRTHTVRGVAGDPINVAFAGSEDALLRAMAAAHWFPADPVTFRSALRITVDSLARRPYDDAPVSTLLIDGRRQDLAFEQPAAHSPAKRHHVRFWRLATNDAQGRPLWLAAATFDISIGVTHPGWHVTHHIDADIDAERDKLVADLRSIDGIAADCVDGFQTEREGRNGGGDPFHTDGRLALIVEQAPAK